MFNRTVIGWLAIACIFGCYGLAVNPMARAIGGGMAFIVVWPIVFLVLWAILSALVGTLILNPTSGNKRVQNALGYGVLLVVALLAFTLMVFHVHSKSNQPGYQGL